MLEEGAATAFHKRLCAAAQSQDRHYDDDIARSLILSEPLHDDSMSIAILFGPGRQSIIKIQSVRWNSHCG
jgi:hypothetical protein